MKRVGAHVSISGGVENAPKNAEEIGAKAFAMFTKNQRQWKTKEITENSVLEFKERIKEMGILPEHILPHDGYLINLGNSDEEKWKKSFDSFVVELKRVEKLGLKLLNIHPGSHLKTISEEKCIVRIAKSINLALKEVKNITVVLENTAGQGTNIGYRFEQLRDIIDLVEDKSRIGVCIDTCHMFAAGYDIRTREAYEKSFSEFEKIVGFKYLKAMHINDAKSNLGSRVDRHHSLGKGNIGIEAFKFIMNDPRMEEIPLILETIDDSIWKKEIELLYSFVK